MKGLDTNVLMRYLTEDDSAQFARTSELLEQAEDRGDRFFVNPIVLCELAWTLRGARYRYERSAIAGAIEKLLEVPLFEIESRDQVLQALTDYRAGPRDFADYLIGWLNREAGCEETATFDSRLDGCGAFEILKTRS